MVKISYFLKFRYITKNLMTKITFKSVLAGAFLCLSLILPTSGFSLTYTSNGAGLQQWNDPASWNVLGIPSLVVPGAADNVIIATGDPITVPAGSGSFSITNVTISSGVTLTNNSDNGTLTITGILTYTNNTSVLTNGTNASLSLTKNVSNLGTAGILNASAAGNTVTFGASVTSIYAPSSNQFVNLTLSGASTKILSFDVTVTGNFQNAATSVYFALSGGAHKMTLGGNFTDNNNNTSNAYMKISLTGGIPIQNINRAIGGAGFAYFFAFDVQVGAGTVLLNTPIVVGGSGSTGVTLQNGTLDANAAQNNLILNYSDWSNTGGTFLPRKGTVQFCPYGPAAGASSVGKAGGTETFNNITITASSAAAGATVKQISNWSMSGNMQISSGASAPTLNQQTFNITINGNWLNQGGIFTFTAGSTATVTFAGGVAPGSPQTISNGGLTFTFNNVVQLCGANITLQLLTPIQINGNFTQTSGIFDVKSGSNFAVSVKGNVVINGTFNTQSGTFNLIAGGSAPPQTISGTGTTFFNLKMNNAAGASFTGGTWKVSNSIIPTAGTLTNSGGTVTLLSTALKTAFIATGNAAGSSFAGNYVIQRFISARDSGYHFMASPVTNATINQWDQQMILSGVGGIHGSACGAHGCFYSVNTYSSAGANGSFVPVTSTATPISSLTGYDVYFADGSGTTFAARTLTFTGTPASGNQTTSVNFTAGVNTGFALIGNPFASFVSWAAIKGVSDAALDPSCYIVDATDHWTAYAADVSIPSGQAFLVGSDVGTANIHINEATKTASTTTTFLKPVHLNPSSLKFKLSAPSISHLYHEISINFNAAATMQYDRGLDAKFIISPNPEAPSFAFIADKNALTVNSFDPSVLESVSIPVKLMLGKDERYTIESFGVSTMTDYSCAILEDLQLNRRIDLKQQGSYVFDGKTTDNPDRFILHLSRKNLVCERMMASTSSSALFYTNNQVQAYATDGAAVVKFDLDQATSANISVFNLAGQKVISDMRIDAYKETLNIDLSSNPSGIYLITINLGGDQMITKKVMVRHQD
jgi:hypothetical protein